MIEGNLIERKAGSLIEIEAKPDFGKVGMDRVKSRPVPSPGQEIEFEAGLNFKPSLAKEMLTPTPGGSTGFGYMKDEKSLGYGFGAGMTIQNKHGFIQNKYGLMKNKQTNENKRETNSKLSKWRINEKMRENEKTEAKQTNENQNKSRKQSKTSKIKKNK